MTLQAAKALAAAVLDAGYGVQVTLAGPGDWRVQTNTGVYVDRPTIDAFAAQHGATVLSYFATTAVTFD